ncbi:pseudouridine synthase deg1 [Coemansia sp. RSA 521]|nr:pseudouridine synthase deg1 [Coemansia sp. RSA 521]KAJ2271447.1 pseudouridine synthase deg1 [Coemansia sp. RSA 371]
MDYESWTKDELIAKLRSLDVKCNEHVKRPPSGSVSPDSTPLADPAPPSDPAPSSDPASPAPPRKRKGRMVDFDFSRFPQRKVAFKFSYLGWPYHGLARQGNSLTSEEKHQIELTYPTVEGALFKALAHCKLITSETTCDYSRCGRTDRGVSGFGQVVAMYVRSTGKFITEEEARVIVDAGQEHLIIRDAQNGGRPVLLPSNEHELTYINMLNKSLPPEIRIHAWSPVAPSFSARFSCKSRFYRYFFPQSGLDIQAMQEAAKRYEGAHDFRNFCRLDPAKQIKNFERIVQSAQITRVSDQVKFVGDGQSEEGVWWQLELRGTAFLWHQVRCMMAVLFAVGQRLETPDVVDHMMDIQMTNGKPEYEMASDLPLVLADCAFDEKDVKWIRVRSPGRDSTNMVVLDRIVSKTWGELNTQAVIASALLQTVRDTQAPMLCERGSMDINYSSWSECRKQLLEADTQTVRVILGGGAIKQAKKYTPIMLRNRAEPVELRNQAWLERKTANKRARTDE